MNLLYKEVKPKGILNKFVQCFWSLTNNGNELKHPFLPDGYFNHIVEYIPGKAPRIMFTGIWTEPLEIIVPANSILYAIRFKLPAAQAIFQTDLKSLHNSSKYVCIPNWNLNIYQNNSLEFFAVDVSRYFLKRLKLTGETDTRKSRLFELIYKNEFYSVSELSQLIGWSTRQINRYFNQYFGFSLKEYLNIIRCQYAYNFISSGVLFPQNGFFDQAHFIKVIKKYTGTTPRELYKHKSDRFLQLSTMYES